ncbi:MAG TPA: biotin/lipoyl-containing protein, partial [Terrimesophilobacter sp.]|uniref:biotin/lipoyl-containing protein n=1 Tax=Terrimesophilobacter sp. TaxID=2906435 RepID=UPI002F9270B3
MSESVNLPALGESVTEGTVTRWLKNVGDRVEVDEPLVEVSTDKVDTEIPSPIAGVLEAILVAEDETVEVGTALARIGDGTGGGEAPVASAPEAAQAAEPEATEEAPEAPEAPSQFAPAPVPAFAPAPESAPEPAPVPEPVAAAEPTPAAEPAPTAEAAPVAAAEPEPAPEAAPPA